MKCERCNGTVLRVLEVEGYERQCVACGRVPEADLEELRSSAALTERWMEGKSRRRQPSINGQVI